jgi:hypothetical protein
MKLHLRSHVTVKGAAWRTWSSSSLRSRSCIWCGHKLVRSLVLVDGNLTNRACKVTVLSLMRAAKHCVLHQRSQETRFVAYQIVRPFLLSCS